MLPTVVVLVLFRCLSALRPPLRVYAGHDDINNEFPFVVRLDFVSGFQWCSGSLIARNWVLTAGHCTEVKDFVVRYANFTMEDATGAVARVLKVITHPNYKMSQILKLTRNDIALLKTTNIPDKTIGKLSALDYRTLIGLPVKFAGFGCTNDHGVQFNRKKAILQVGEAVVTPYFRGDSKFHKRLSITISLSPKSSKRQHGAQPGDSGGPSIYDGKIVGVFAVYKYPLYNSTTTLYSTTIYTAVSPYLPWIQHQMQMNGYKPS